MVKVTHIKQRRRKLNEYPTARIAIRNFCIECMGYQVYDIGGCTDNQCWLYPWRMGKTPDELKKKMSDEDKERLKQQLKGG